MEPKVVIDHVEYATANKMDLKIKGEVFDRPIKRTQNGQEFFTRVEVIDMETEEVINRVFFLKENDTEELIDLVNSIKKEPKYLKRQ